MDEYPSYSFYPPVWICIYSLVFGYGMAHVILYHCR